jgi:hypothetical protein
MVNLWIFCGLEDFASQPTFQKLKHLCRFKKGEYCNNIRFEAQNCPQIRKGE